MERTGKNSRSHRRRTSAGMRKRETETESSNSTTTRDEICSESSGPCPILELPDDVLYVIFQYMSPGTLCKLCQVCQRFRHLASEDSVWLPHEKERILLRTCNSCSRTYRHKLSVKDRYRVSLNWENGHRRETWMLKFRNKLLPWLQREEDTLWASRGNSILQFNVQKNGYLREKSGGALVGLESDVTRFVVRNGIVVSGSRGGGVSTWEASSGVQLLNIKDADGSDTQCVDVVDQAIIAGYRDGVVKVLSIFPEDLQREKKSFNVTDRIWSLSASSDKTTVAVGTACYNNPGIALLDISSGELLGHLGDKHKRGAGVLDLKFESPNTLLSCGHDTYLRLWDLRTHTCVMKWEDEYDSAVYCLQSDGLNTMLTGTARHGGVRLWDKRQPQHIQLYYSGNQNSPVFSLAGSSHHLYLAMDLGVNLVDFSIR